jgi:hypothetical protein
MPAKRGTISYRESKLIHTNQKGSTAIRTQHIAGHKKKKKIVNTEQLAANSKTDAASRLNRPISI